MKSLSFKFVLQKASLLPLLSLALAFVAWRGEFGTQAQSTPMPITGQAVSGMESYDLLIPALLTKWQIPGGAVAVVRNGKLVFARGYGFADSENAQAVQPDALFRIASISKPITAAPILKLVEEGKLDLDAKVFELLSVIPLPGANVDARLANITIRHLLYHAGGWNRTQTFDPMFISRQAAQAAGVPAPAEMETIMRVMHGMPLQFNPGTEYQYSNYGYALLGRVIEKVTGQKYEAYVKEKILRRAGVDCMRIGRTLLADRAEREVRYYNFPGGPLAQSVFPTGPQSVPWPYGGFYLEAMEANGGWLASTIDLLRFATAVDGLATRPDILQPATINQMVARPNPPLWVGSAAYYAMGWSVRPTSGDANWWHAGNLPGTQTLLVRTYHGLAWAALFNSRPAQTDTFAGELDATLWQAANSVPTWPEHDLFPQFTGCASPGPLACVSAASYDAGRVHAPESIVAAFGAQLASGTYAATDVPLPSALAGTSVRLKDSAGIERAAPLFFVAPTQINYLIPAGMALGAATVTVIQDDLPVARGEVLIAAQAPGLFTANADGRGVPAAYALRIKSNGEQLNEPVARYDQAQGGFVPVPLDLGAETDQLFLVLFGTGLRGRSSLAAVTLNVGGINAEVTFAGETPGLFGLDQVNVRLPRQLAGRGAVNLLLTVDTKAANTVGIVLR